MKKGEVLGKNFNTHNLKEYIKVFTKIDSKFVTNNSNIFKKLKSTLFNGFEWIKEVLVMQRSNVMCLINMMEKIGIAGRKDRNVKGDELE